MHRCELSGDFKLSTQTKKNVTQVKGGGRNIHIIIQFLEDTTELSCALTGSLNTHFHKRAQQVICFTKRHFNFWDFRKVSRRPRHNVFHSELRSKDTSNVVADFVRD